MNIQLSVTLQSGTSAKLHGTGEQIRNLKLTATGDSEAVQYLKQLLQQSHIGFNQYDGPWAGLIGGDLIRLTEVLTTTVEVNWAWILAPASTDYPEVEALPAGAIA